MEDELVSKVFEVLKHHGKAVSADLFEKFLEEEAPITDKKNLMMAFIGMLAGINDCENIVNLEDTK